MIGIVISTSMESNLFKELNYLVTIPWMRATLWDFYANILVIYVWVAYKESSIFIKIIWAVLFFCLGSIGTIGYLLIQLFKLKPDETALHLFIKKNS
jgi:hypothetical protein